MTQNVLTFGVVTAPELYMAYGEITRSRAAIQQMGLRSLTFQQM